MNKYKYVITENGVQGDNHKEVIASGTGSSFETAAVAAKSALLAAEQSIRGEDYFYTATIWKAEA
jgi:hypothetical protein